MAQSTNDDEIAASILLTQHDLGPDWKSLDELAREAGQLRDAAGPVEPALIDPGIEDPDVRCGVSYLIGIPDGVKTGAATAQWIRQQEDTGGLIATSAAVFPAEKNAEARFAAYEKVLRRCNEELLLGFQSEEELPNGLRPTIEVEEIDLPMPALALRFKSGLGLAGFGDGDQTEIVVRRGRVIAALSMNNMLGSGTLPDPKVLAAILFERAEAGTARLNDDESPLPIWEADGDSQAAADAALAGPADFPSVWKASPTQEAIVLGSGVTEIQSFGSRMYLMSGSGDCGAGNLHPTAGMLARAGTSLIKVGHDHDLWHYAAVFDDAETAKERVATILAANKRCGEEILAQRSPEVDITWTPIEIAPLDTDVHVSVGIQRWKHAAHDPFPPRESVTTEATIVVRRGRMIATASFVTGAENPQAVEEVVRTIVRKLESASSALND